MKHLLELVTDVLGNDEQTQILDSSACGTRTTSRQHGKQEQHPGELRPQVVVIRCKPARGMYSSYLKSALRNAVSRS